MKTVWDAMLAKGHGHLVSTQTGWVRSGANGRLCSLLQGKAGGTGNLFDSHMIMFLMDNLQKIMLGSSLQWTCNSIGRVENSYNVFFLKDNHVFFLRIVGFA